METIIAEFDCYDLYDRWGEGLRCTVTIEFDRDSLLNLHECTPMNLRYRDHKWVQSSDAFISAYPIDREQMNHDVKHHFSDMDVLEEYFVDTLSHDDYINMFPQYQD